MSRRAGLVVFAAMFVVAMVCMIPMSLVAGRIGSSDGGLSARRATGTMWSGALYEARVGDVAVGDLGVSISPLSLLVGRIRASFHGPFGQGAYSTGGGRAGIDNVTAHITTAGLFGQVPVAAIDLDDVTVFFNGASCEKAEGRVRATFGSAVAGLTLSQGLSGVATCQQGRLLLPLVSQSAMERLNLRIAGNGRYEGEFIVRASDPALAAALREAGFVTTQSGSLLRISGTL